MIPAVPLAEIPDPQLFMELAARHGHFCPMSTLGLRIGWAARRRLVGELREATYLAQTCARDGIRLVLGLESLAVKAQDRHRLLLSDAGQTWAIELTPQALQLAASYRSLAGEAERERLLEELRTADEGFLLRVAPIGEL